MVPPRRRAAVTHAAAAAAPAPAALTELLSRYIALCTRMLPRASPAFVDSTQIMIRTQALQLMQDMERAGDAAPGAPLPSDLVAGLRGLIEGSVTDAVIHVGWAIGVVLDRERDPLDSPRATQARGAAASRQLPGG
jgi:hypothetical protein